MEKKNYINLLSIFVCLIPFSLVIGPVVSELLIILSVIFFLFYSFSFKEFSYFKNKIFLLIILFSFLNLFGSLFSEFPINSLRSTLFYFRFSLLILVILFLLNNHNNFIKYFLISISVSLIICFLFSVPEIYVSFFDIKKDYRVSGLFEDELIQGSYVLRLFIIFFALTFFVKNIKYKNYLLIFVSIISLIMIILSGERAAIGLFIIYSTMILFFLKINFFNKLAIALTLIFIFIVSIHFVPGLKSRIVDNTKNLIFENNSIKAFSRGHQEHYTTALKIFNENHFFGVGVRNFRLECRKEKYKNIGVNACTTHPHNTYIQLLSETGLVGFIFVIGFFIYLSFFIVLSFYKKLKDKNFNFFSVSLAIAIFINLFPIVPTGSFFNNWLSTMYFLPIPFFIYSLKKR